MTTTAPRPNETKRNETATLPPLLSRGQSPKPARVVPRWKSRGDEEEGPGPAVAEWFRENNVPVSGRNSLDWFEDHFAKTPPQRSKLLSLLKSSITDLALVRQGADPKEGYDGELFGSNPLPENLRLHSADHSVGLFSFCLANLIEDPILKGRWTRDLVLRKGGVDAKDVKDAIGDALSGYLGEKDSSVLTRVNHFDVCWVFCGSRVKLFQIAFHCCIYSPVTWAQKFSN